MALTENSLLTLWNQLQKNTYFCYLFYLSEVKDKVVFVWKEEEKKIKFCKKICFYKIFYIIMSKVWHCDCSECYKQL